MNGAAIRAGKAFVEFFVKDETIEPALLRIKAKMATLGTVIDRAGAETRSAMESQAAPAIMSTGGKVGALATGLIALQALAGTVSGAFNSAFGRITTSVGKATLSIGALSYVVSSFAKGTRLEGVLDGFLNKSQQTEATGRWTRFWGAITGSREIREMGFRMERLGMGASIVNGLKKSGIVGGLSATVGVAYRSVTGMAVRGAASLITSPFRMAFSGARSVVSSFVPHLDKVKNSADGTTASLTKTAGAAKLLSSGSFNLGKMLGGISLKLGAFSAMILGPAIGAARSFVASSQEMIKESEKTKTSLEDLIALKYGSNSLISPSDVKAAAELGDLMKVLKNTIAAAWAQIGVAALPTLIQMTQSSLEWANVMVRLIRDNRQWITTAVRIASVVGTVAAGFGAASAVLLAMGTAASVVTNPLALIAGGIVAIAYIFPELRDAASETFGWLFGNFGELATVVSQTMQAVQDALMGGNIKAAANVLWAGLKLAWLSGTEQLRDVWRQMTNNIASFGINVFSSFRTAWVHTTRFLFAAWHDVLGAMRSVWQGTQNWFAKGFAKVIAKMSGQDVNDVLATLNEMQDQERKAHGESVFDQKMKETEAETNARLAGIEAERQAMQQGLKDELEGRRTAAKAELEAARKEFGEQRDAAAKLRPDLKAQIEAPGKQKKAEKERQQQPISSADIRSQEGLQNVIKSLFDNDKAKETANNTAKTASLLGQSNVKLGRAVTLLDRIDRGMGNDVVPLNQASFAT